MKYTIATIAALLVMACSSNNVMIHNLDNNTIVEIKQDSINNVTNIIASHADEEEIMHFYVKAPAPRDTLYCEVPKESVVTICDQSVQNLTTLANTYIKQGYEISAGVSNPSTLKSNEYCVMMSR